MSDLESENRRLRQEIVELAEQLTFREGLIETLAGRLTEIGELHGKNVLGLCASCNPNSVDRRFPCRTRRLAGKLA